MSDLTIKIDRPVQYRLVLVPADDRLEGHDAISADAEHLRKLGYVHRDDLYHHYWALLDEVADGQESDASEALYRALVSVPAMGLGVDHLRPEDDDDSELAFLKRIFMALSVLEDE